MEEKEDLTEMGGDIVGVVVVVWRELILGMGVECRVRVSGCCL